MKFNKTQVIDPKTNIPSESSEPEINLQGKLKRKVNAKVLMKEKDVLKQEISKSLVNDLVADPKSI